MATAVLNHPQRGMTTLPGVQGDMLELLGAVWGNQRLLQKEADRRGVDRSEILREIGRRRMELQGQ
ncbi:hypothetical protein HY374_00500 [Candidatus Berkelbacteria bacterium]|nr:hypothetical protein [Candidatus Berkelbacteria bacterium]